MQNIVAYFAINGVPALNLSPTIRIHELLTGSPNSILVIDDDVMSEIKDGYYKYIFITYDPRKEYVFRANGGTSLPTTDRFAVGATESPDPEENADATWNSIATDFITAATMGLLQNEIGADTSAIRLNIIDIVDFVDQILKYEKNRTFLDKAAKTLTVYDDDRTTPLRVFSLRDSTGTPSIIEIVERLPIGPGSPV